MQQIRNTLRWICACAVLGYCAAMLFSAFVIMGDFCYAFFSGFAIEFVAVFWTHATIRKQRWRAGALSGVQALALVYGVTLSGQSVAVCAAFVLGYALGSVAAVSMKGHAGRT